MSKAKLIYAIAGLVREVRIGIEQKNRRIEELERQQAERKEPKP